MQEPVIFPERRPLPADWSERAPTMADVDRVVDVLNARSEGSSGTGPSTPARVKAWWEKPGFVLATDMRLVFDPRGAVAGLAFLLADGEPYTHVECTSVVHPRHESNDLVWDWLGSWSLRRAAELGSRAAPGLRVAATSTARPDDAAHCAALARAGFRAVRVESHMRIGLDSPVPVARWPVGISVRPARMDADVDGIVDTYLEAMRDHWGFVEPPRAQVRATFVNEIESRCGPIDPTLWFLATAGVETVGIALCIDGLPDDPTGGYVYQLCVRPAWRKQGIALALLHHAFAEFQRRGRTAVELDVDSQSLTGALRLYERAGMRAVEQSVTYEKELRPGIDLATRELAS